MSKQMYTIVDVIYPNYDPTERNTVAASLDIPTLQQAVDYYKANESLIKNVYREYVLKRKEFSQKENSKYNFAKMDEEQRTTICKQIKDQIDSLFSAYFHFIENEIIYNILRDWGTQHDFEIESTPLY